jgi:hypothetical protein
MSRPPISQRVSPPDPDTMAPAARRAEVASILAPGFLRLRLDETKKKETPVGILPRLSDKCLERESRGERQ